MAVNDETNTLSIAVIGLGNVLFFDEGLGVYASQLLKHNYQFEPPIDIIDGGTAGMRLINYYHDYQHLFLLDTLALEDTSDGHSKAGELYGLDAESLQGLGDIRRTAHEIEVLQTLELSALTGAQAEVRILAMVPADINKVAFGLSDEVKQQLPQMVLRCAQQLESLGIQVTEISNPLSVDKLVLDYQNHQFSNQPA